MGICQTIEAVAVTTVAVQHPGKHKVERIFWPIKASEVMGLNPGYYVALVVPPSKNNNLKLLRPDDIMRIGHLYRLISFEDVIKDFTLEKSEKLGGGDKNKNNSQEAGAEVQVLGMMMAAEDDGSRRCKALLKSDDELQILTCPAYSLALK